MMYRIEVNNAISISQATKEQVNDVAFLFDCYRVFYRQPSNYNAAKEFIAERFDKQDSVILLATKENKPVGYTQLFPSFSSVSMKRVWILNDLFVISQERNQGIAKALMNEAKKYAIATKAVRIILATEVTNIAAQSLYKTMGYRKLDEFNHYILTIN